MESFQSALKAETIDMTKVDLPGFWTLRDEFGFELTMPAVSA
jgi:hypothetical protein